MQVHKRYILKLSFKKIYSFYSLFVCKTHKNSLNKLMNSRFANFAALCKDEKYYHYNIQDRAIC